jgi:hypothetical protein
VCCLGSEQTPGQKGFHPPAAVGEVKLLLFWLHGSTGQHATVAEHFQVCLAARLSMNSSSGSSKLLHVMATDALGQHKSCMGIGLYVKVPGFQTHSHHAVDAPSCLYVLLCNHHVHV